MNKCLYCGENVKNKYCNVSCQNKHQGSLRANKKYGQFKKFKVTCEKCENDFIVEEREKLFPQKEKYYCSKNCANSRNWSDKDKKKKSESLTGKEIIERITISCKECGKLMRIPISNNRVFCSRSCTTKWYNKNTDRCRRAGLKSCEKQKYNRRSKNEIYFSELCKNEFNDVKINEQIFNGWDADIIIHDIKYAVLWNGVWHYKKITKKHSVEQVQNRDKIKIDEIKKSGYKPYIIKDMGSYDKLFVENEFENFKDFLKITNQTLNL